MIDKKTTIQQIAAAAGVSPATVSRVLNHRDLVKAETIQQVETAMKQFDFQWEAAADPRSGKGLIIINVPSLENLFYNEIIKGARVSAQNQGYHLLINVEHLNSTTVDHFLQMLKSCRAIGLITLNHIGDETLAKLSAAIPIVQCCEYNKNFDLPFVSVDDLAATQTVMDYILSRGRRKIAFMNGPARFKYAKARRAGYEQALLAAGLETRNNWMVQLPEVDFDMAYSAANQVLRAPDRPDAFFAISDIYAAAIISAAKKNNLSVPRDLAVVGFDNINVALMSNPTITTVNQPKFQIGFMGCEMLCERLENPSISVQNVLLGTELVIREST